MSKIIDILKEYLASLEAWVYLGKELSAKIEKTKEAIAELGAQEVNNCDVCKWNEYCNEDEPCKSSKYLRDKFEHRGY